jgi:mRNA interferase MazF
MEKDFDRWNGEKKSLHLFAKEFLIFHEREIWWCSLGLNLGDEEDGKNEYYERPVLVIKKFNNRIAWVLPMSSKIKEGPYYHTLKYGDTVSCIILSQLRLLSIKRFRRHITKVPSNQFLLIKERLHALLK